MDLLNVLVCISAIIWIAVGIRTHSDWIQSIFAKESKKIRQQAEMVHKFGYDSLGSCHKLSAKKGLVFAYWDTPIRKQKYKEFPERFQSPVIFQLVTLNLISGTSILLLIFLSKGFFSSIGLIWLLIRFDRKIDSLYRAKLFFHQGDASGQSCWSLLSSGRCSSEYREILSGQCPGQSFDSSERQHRSQQVHG